MSLAHFCLRLSVFYEHAAQQQNGKQHFTVVLWEKKKEKKKEGQGLIESKGT